tara:strand:+ start:2427 stop:3467 length:1041 start_codon:yes stop_codon:yes gene_type:complete
MYLAMKEKLLEIINKRFPYSNTDINEWQKVLENCNSIPSCNYLLSMVDYYVAYNKDRSAINLSIVLYQDKEALGIMPLFAHQNQEEEWILSSNGIEIVEPIFKKTVARRVKKRFENELKDLIYDLARQLEIKQCQFVNSDFFALSRWYFIWAERAKETFSTHHFLVDLSLSLQDIRLKFRKSFKPFINKGLREWTVEVHEQTTDELFEKFRLLHKSVAGRTTRPIESWNKQKEQIDSMESFIVTVSAEDDEMVGAGLFTYSRDSGFYCVGAYKRELSDQPLGHAVQMKAIETFKKNGVKWYEIGLKRLKIDKKTPTEKELALTHFKQGFATHVVARQHLTVDLNLD